ncbi:ABC transporter substrate-binding protein [Chitinimonas sp. BJB300]|uniref:ABC transporter substrate-binding protein n=1 Tax=Chitinimonas sp. BJB300 TaxID=1559339 RepID=UPI000C0C7076|nr:iron-siderophore ABC transporter substrate-binding protein [Chitinimonas sp. BJB300]PHV11875.1 ABC transporter substrate-binding protein [Chitinimonas sp. BJB300]TSJ87766.1 iron-siderophore ABC transporter substrate-binding protein [Chitinimonas sp. BJB300]
MKMLTQLRTALLVLCSAAALAGMHMVNDAQGRAVAVPDAPRRIVALSELDLDAVLALGIKPVGATLGRGQGTMPRYLGTAATGITPVGQFASPVLDKVLALKPDLILAGGMPDAEMLALLGKVAPTVVSYKLGEDWQTALRRIADMTGRTNEAQTVLSGYQQKTSALRGRLGPAAGARVSVVRWNPQGPAYMLRDAFSSKVLADIGLQRPAGQDQAGIAHSPPLSMESLQRIDGDWLFVGTLAADGQASEAMSAARHSSAFRQLAAVRNGRMVAVDGSLWTSLGGPLAAHAMLTEVEKVMTSPSAPKPAVPKP